MGAIVDVAKVIDRPRLGSLQVIAITLCSAAAVMDGFDILAIAFVASPIAQSLQVDVSSFGAVFGIGSFGLLVGSLLLGSIADRVGRKPMIIFAMLIIGIFTLLTPYVRSFPELLAVRFFASLGIGGLMPNIIALTAEYSPRRWRATVVTVMFCGISVGAMLAGMASAAIVGKWGWQGMFYVGGVLPFLLIPLFLIFLPESLAFLITCHSAPVRSLAILRRLDPLGGYSDDVRLILPESKSDNNAARLSGLFAHGRARVTPFLWLIFFCNGMMWFFLTNWLPTILELADFPRERAAFAAVVLYGGGMLGGLGFAWMVDKGMSYGRLALIYLLGAVFVVSIGLAAKINNPILLATILGAGFFVCGAQFAINAIAANFYPTELRSTGVGWAIGIGRFGSILGPALGGILLALQWNLQQLVGVLVIPALFAAIAATIIGWNLRRAT